MDTFTKVVDAAAKAPPDASSSGGGANASRRTIGPEPSGSGKEGRSSSSRLEREGSSHSLRSGGDRHRSERDSHGHRTDRSRDRDRERDRDRRDGKDEGSRRDGPTCEYDGVIGWAPVPGDRLEPAKAKRLRGSLKVYTDVSGGRPIVTKRFFEMVIDDCTLRRYGSKEDYGSGMLPQHVLPIGAVSWVAELDHPDTPCCIVVHFDNEAEIKLLAHDADDREAWIQAFSDLVAKVEDAATQERLPPLNPSDAPLAALTSTNRVKGGLLSAQVVTAGSKSKAKGGGAGG